MPSKLARATLILALPLLLVLLAGIGGACSDEATSTTAEASAGTDTSPATAAVDAVDPGSDSASTQGDERVVVGGKTAEEYTAMVPELEQALEADPDNLETLQQLAVAQYNSGDYEGAAATYEKMLSIDDTAFARNNYANVLRDWNKTEDAVANYEKSISMDKALVTPYLNLASVLAGQGKIDEAIATLESALPSVSPDDKKRVEDYLSKLKEAQ